MEKTHCPGITVFIYYMRVCDFTLQEAEVVAMTALTVAMTRAGGAMSG